MFGYKRLVLETSLFRKQPTLTNFIPKNTSRASILQRTYYFILKQKNGMKCRAIVDQFTTTPRTLKMFPSFLSMRRYTSLHITENKEENRKYWDNVLHQRYFLDKIYQKLNFKSMEDWYNLPPIELIKLGGGEVLSRYSTSLPQMLQSLYPEMHFNSVYYGKTFFHNSFWTSNENLRYYLDYLAVNVLNFNSIEDWFKITAVEIGNVVGGKILLQRNDDNILRALKVAYPEIKIEVLKQNLNVYDFENSFWESKQYQRNFLEQLKPLILKSSKYSKSKSTTDDDNNTSNDNTNNEFWYFLTNEMIRNNGGSGLLLQYNNINEILPAVYPEVDWDVCRFGRRGGKSKDDSKAQKVEGENDESNILS